MSGGLSQRWPDLGTRIIVGGALAFAATVSLIVGNLLFWLLCVVLSLIMMGEWADLHRLTMREKRIGQFALSVPLAVMAPPSLVIENRNFFALGLLIGAAFFAVIVTRRRSLALGVLYCGLPVLALTLIRRQHAPQTDSQAWGMVWTLWALGLVWMVDIGAYFTGRMVGGPKLAPAISPAKTWAGLAGGVLLASLFAALMHVRFGLPMRLTLATPVLAILAQAGDLYESWLKRRAGVKDSGTLLPGHGGALDRLDGLVPVAPVAAFLAVLPSVLHFSSRWHA